MYKIKVNMNNIIKNKLNENSDQCLEKIGKSLGEYTNFHKILGEMSDNAINQLHDAIIDVKFHRKRFTDFVTCTREEADKPADDTRSIGYFTYGEFGGEDWQNTFDDEMAEYEPDVKFSPTDLKKQGGGRPSKLEMRLMHMYGLTANSTGDVNDIQYKKAVNKVMTDVLNSGEKPSSSLINLYTNLLFTDASGRDL